VTSSTGPSLSSANLAKLHGLKFYAIGKQAFSYLTDGCKLSYIFTCLSQDNEDNFLVKQGSNAEAGNQNGSLSTGLMYAYGLDEASDAGYSIDRTNLNEDNCSYWYMMAGTPYGTSLASPMNSVILYFQTLAIQNFFSAYSACSMSGTKTLHFWGSPNTLSDAKLTVGSSGTVLHYGGATFTIEPGCGPCGCGDCSSSATLNDGAGGSAQEYPCIPQSVTISLENVSVTEGGLPGGDTATLDAVKAALDGLPGVVAPLYQRGNGALCDQGYFYQGTYSLGAGAGAITFSARLYCDACGKHPGGIGVSYGSLYGYNLGACATISLAPSTSSPWTVTTGHAISAMSFGATGLWANSGDQIPDPTLSVKTVCSGGASVGVYDATSAQDLGPSQVTVSGYSGFAGTLWFTEATIRVSVP
jgi:hypothetical protein